MRQIDDLGEGALIGGGEIGDIDASLGPAQRRHQGDEQHRRAIAPGVDVARIVNLAENRDESLHGSLPKSRSLLNESFSTSRAMPLCSSAIPLP